MSIYARAVPLPGAGSGLRDSESELVRRWRITGIRPGLNASSKHPVVATFARQRTMFRSDVTDNTVCQWVTHMRRKQDCAETHQHYRLDLTKLLPGISHAQTRLQH